MLPFMFLPDHQNLLIPIFLICWTVNRLTFFCLHSNSNGQQYMLPFMCLPDHQNLLIPIFLICWTVNRLTFFCLHSNSNGQQNMLPFMCFPNHQNLLIPIFLLLNCEQAKNFLFTIFCFHLCAFQLKNNLIKSFWYVELWL